MRFYLQNFLFLLYCVPHRFSLIGLLCIINGSHCVLALLCFINDNLNTISAYSIPSLPSLVPPPFYLQNTLTTFSCPPSILLNTYSIPSLPSLVPLPLLSFLILIAYPHNLLLSPAPSILLNTYRIPSLPSLVPPLSASSKYLLYFQHTLTTFPHPSTSSKHNQL